MARSASAGAGDEASSLSAAVRLYNDDDHVTIWSPHAQGTAAFDRSAVDLSFNVDVVSAASVDVISQASPNAVEETRLEGGVSVRRDLARRTEVLLGGIVSHEDDYDALRLQLGSTSELFGRQTTLELGLTAGFDWVGAVTLPEFSETRQGYQLSASVTQILDRDTYADLVLEAINYVGYHASPYRTVPVRTSGTTAIVRVPEATPERRTAGAVLLRLRRALGSPARVFLHAEYRGYRDSWDVSSHTVSIEPLAEFHSAIRFGLVGRFYTQGSADFYDAEYERTGAALPAYRTRDRTLGGMHSYYGGGVLDVALAEEAHAVADVGLVQFYFHDFPLQEKRAAILASLGAAYAF